jgi:GTP cyclohydrolase IA
MKMKTRKISRKKIEEGIRLALEGTGENPQREGLKDTPRRVADLYEEIFAGLRIDPQKELKIYNTPNQDEMIIARDIPFYSMCEHHLLPFFGKVHIAYVPRKNRVTGFSHLARVIEIMAKRPQLQERLSSQIADVLMQGLKAKGVLVLIEAEQLCLTMRGSKKQGVSTITSAIRGVMKKPNIRAEALGLIKNK